MANFPPTILILLILVTSAAAHGGSNDDDDGGDGPPPNLHAKSLILVKIWCLLLVFAGTFAGGVSPYFLKWNEGFLVLGTQFAGGVFLGTAMMHFLSDSNETFEDLTSKTYPFAFMLASAGYVITMLADCLILMVVARGRSVRDVESAGRGSLGERKVDGDGGGLPTSAAQFAVWDLKTRLRQPSAQTRRLILDPTIHEQFTRLKNLVDEQDRKVKELQDKVVNASFTTLSKIGQMLIAKCRTLQELGLVLSKQESPPKMLGYLDRSVSPKEKS